MALTVTTCYRHNANQPEETTSLVGQVLSCKRTSVRVSSDHAWLDSGNRLAVEYWDPETRSIRLTLVHTDDYQVECTPDATPAVVAAADLYRRTVTWVRASVDRLRAAVRAAEAPERGMAVEVVRSRKCPRGTYTLDDWGENHFGKYYHLRAGDRVHRFINPDNCRLVPRPVAVDGVEYPDLFAEMVRGSWDGPLRRLAAALAEAGDERSGPVLALLTVPPGAHHDRDTWLG